jgi:hypothetical protein
LDSLLLFEINEMGSQQDDCVRRSMGMNSIFHDGDDCGGVWKEKRKEKELTPFQDQEIGSCGLGDVSLSNVTGCNVDWRHPLLRPNEKGGGGHGAAMRP